MKKAFKIERLFFMKKVQISAPYKVEMIEVEKPKAGENQILVKAELSGISAGTEMMLYRGSYPNLTAKRWPDWSEYPVYPGYEMVGIVEEVGSGAKGEFKKGDRVICLGEHAQYVAIPIALAAKIPDNMTSEEATLAVLATTAMHAIRRADIQYGDTVAVVGCGVLGYLVMQHAKISGARRVISLDINESRLQLAKETGADLCINPAKEDAQECIKAFNGGVLADVVIEVSGFNGTAEQALQLVRERGRVVLLGWNTEDVHFSFSEFYFKEATIVASQAIGPVAGLPYSYVRWTSDQSLRWAVDLLANHKLTGAYFTPTKFCCDEIAKVYDMIDKRDPAVGLQTVLMW
ncbi:MAG: zinc-binding alcohol dehydrogenase [Ruthenibacterium sp.]